MSKYFFSLSPPFIELLNLLCRYSLRLLRIALGLVETHGFTRDALAHSVLRLPHPETHSVPLSDAAISSLFGQGETPEHTLINLFFDDGLEQMKHRAQVLSESEQRVPTIKELLEERLKFNEPVLDHLPDAFASLVSSTTKFGPFPLSPVDPLPVLRHALRISDEACYLSGDTSADVYIFVFIKTLYVLTCHSSSRGIPVAGLWQPSTQQQVAVFNSSIMMIWLNLVTELHQMSSPKTANQFLESLLASSAKASQALDDVNSVASYWCKSIKAIMKSRGII